jgi:hypothetical protein
MLSRVGFFIVCMCATGVKAKQCRKAVQFLGYNAGKNGQYRRFRDLIKNNLDNEDYREIEKFSRAGAGTGKLSNKSGNTIGLHKKKIKVFMLSRVGFNKSIYAF